MPDHMIGGAWARDARARGRGDGHAKCASARCPRHDFRNPTVFARECAAAMSTTAGSSSASARVADRDTRAPASLSIAGVASHARGARHAHEASVTEEQVTFEGEYYKVEKAESRPKTVQQPHPPLLIAGGGPDILALAGREANVVAIVPSGITGSGQVAPEKFHVETMREQIGLVRDAAGARFGEIELSMFLDCTLTDDREKTIAELAEKAKVDPDLPRNNAYRGIGTLKEIRDHIVRLRDALGITYFCLRGPDVESLGPVVSELSGK